jgi:hypothetical protein
MRYLKKYNESLDTRSKLSEFCKDSLALLVDDGYYIRVYTKTDRDDEYVISIKKVIDFSNVGFDFNDIKDEFIPFYEMLKEKYDLVDIYRGKANYPCFVELLTGDDEHILSDEQIMYSEYEYKSVICLFLIVKV